MSKTVVLLILDGWGIGRRDQTNPIHSAAPSNINHIKSAYQIGALHASGIAVGLPWGEEGNSEVGHCTIGAGRVMYQHFPRITIAIQNGAIFKTAALRSVIAHAQKNNAAFHFISIISETNTHASLDHLLPLIDHAKKSGLQKIRLHLISDGKDSKPRSILALLEKIPFDETVLLASLAGRYYAMDRDRHTDRTQTAYQALLGNGHETADIAEYIQRHYLRNLNDEFVEPVVVGQKNNGITDNDAILFCNFREDSIRQLAAPFILSPETLAEEGWPPTAPMKPKNLLVATMTQYYENAPNAHVIFPPEKISNTLGETLAAHNKFQMRIAETEKYAHISYFLNGLQKTVLHNEYRVLVPSRAIARPDERPEMMTSEIANRVIQALEERSVDCIMANIAAPDVIAHTGNFSAAITAIRAVDAAIGAITKTILRQNAVLIITADHGNIEQMTDPITGARETKHNANPVPIYIVGKDFESPKGAALIAQSESEPIGILADVAPTILQLLNIPKPPEMTGESLLTRLF